MELIPIVIAFFVILTIGTLIYAVIEYALYKRREKRQRKEDVQLNAVGKSQTAYTLTEAREKLGKKPTFEQPTPMSAQVAPSARMVSTDLPLPKPSVASLARPNMPPLPTKPFGMPPLPVQSKGAGDGASVETSIPQVQPTSIFQFAPLSNLTHVQADSTPTEERLLQGSRVSMPTEVPLTPPNLFDIESAKVAANEEMNEAHEEENVISARRIGYEAVQETSVQVEMQAPVAESIQEPAVLPNNAPIAPPPIPVVKSEPDTMRVASSAALMAVPVTFGKAKRPANAQSAYVPQVPSVAVPKPKTATPPARKPAPEKQANVLLWY
jgi:hypothetical protein